MEFLLKELIIEILVLVPDRYIKSFTSTCYLFYPMLNLILKSKRRRNPFPRLDGCKIHHIPEEIIQLENKDYYTNLTELIKTEEKLNYIKQLELIRGDIIEFYPKHMYYPNTMIYNGLELKTLGYNTEGEAYLTDDYKVLMYDVPYCYWKSFGFYVFLPYHQFKEECLNNRLKYKIYILNGIFIKGINHRNFSIGTRSIH